MMLQSGSAAKPCVFYWGMFVSEPSTGNFFADLPTDISEEIIQVMATNQHVRIERIVSNGHASPTGFWYDQEEHEWVIVLTGAARLRFDDRFVDLKPGDFELIPAHCRHCIDWTTPEEPTVWLAVFYRT